MNENKWNISEEAIAAALRDGTSPDELAKAFSAKLNAALNKQKQATQKYKDAEAVVKFLTTYYGEIFEDLTVDIVLKSLDDLASAVGPLAKSFKAAETALKQTLDGKDKPAAKMSLDDLLDIYGR